MPPPGPTGAVKQVLGILDRAGPDGSLARLAVQIWAEAVTDPALRECLAGHYRRTRLAFADLVRRYRDAGALDPDIDIDHVAEVLTAIGPAGRPASSTERRSSWPGGVPEREDHPAFCRTGGTVLP